MSRLPIRLRLTLLFAAAMGAVLAVAGYLTLSRFREAQLEYAQHIDAAGLYARREAVADLRRELLISLPIVLAVATIGAYLLAAATLRPVERMRAQAAAITQDTPTLRLEVPAARDELARLASTLNTMLDRLQNALDHERQFVADASHELRTPLSLLHTELELALRRPRDPAALRAALASAHEEAQRLIRLSEDLLLLARTDGQAHRNGQPATNFLLAPLLEEVVARHGADIDFAIECPVGLRVTAPRTHLERAVTNIVTNAVRHGGSPIEVTATFDSSGVEIHIRDRGPGFPPEFLPTAFDRFTRVDTARTGPGTGLGLAITAALTGSWQGRCEASNRADGGADVWITVPTASMAEGIKAT